MASSGRDPQRGRTGFVRQVAPRRRRSASAVELSGRASAASAPGRAAGKLIDNALAGAEIYALNQEEDNMNSRGRAAVRLAALLLLFVVALPHAFGQAGPPVRIGSTLSLTGP